MRYAGAVKTLLTLSLWAATALAAPTAPLDIRADRMELTQKSGELRFEGHVSAQQGELTLRCARLLARYGKDGALTELRAEGDVQVTAEGLSARAQSAVYQQAAGTLILTGSPTVQRGEDRLSGATITFWPEAGRMVVEQARGTLRAPPLEGLRAP